MAKRNVRRRNRKIKFSEIDYVEKNYMVDDKAIIPVELNKIEDLYMLHDYKKMELADSVCDYIEEIAYMFPVNTDIVIEIHCPKISDDEELSARKAIKNNFGMEIDDIEYDISLLNKRSIMLAIVGIILLIFNILVDKYIGSILSNFLSVVWWIGIWDSIEIQLLDKTNNKWKRLNYQQLYESEITFVYDK